MKKAIELDPKNLRTYIELARAQVLRKTQPRPRRHFKKALTIDPRSPRSWWHSETFSPRPASRAKPRSSTNKRSKSPRKRRHLLKLASFYRLYSKWAEVEATLQKLAALKPQDEMPHIHLGDFLYLAWPTRQGARQLSACDRSESRFGYRPRQADFALSRHREDE